MKNFSKLLVAILLIIALVFNTASCDLLQNMPGINTSTGEDSNTQAPDTDTTPDDDDRTDKDDVADKDDVSDNPTDGDSDDDSKDDNDDNNADVDQGGEDSDGTDSDKNDNTGDNDADLGDDVPGGDDNTSGDNPDDDPTDDPEDEYVFGSEYQDLIIPVSAALDKAQEYTSKASADTYYILVTVDFIIDLGDGDLYVSDGTGDIYIYHAKDKNGNSLANSGLEEGDIAVIAGPLRNYKGTCEIEKGRVLSFYTPGVDIPTPPTDDPDDGNQGGDNIGSGTDKPSDDASGGIIIWPTPGDPITSDPYENVDVDAFYADYRPAISYMDAYYRSQHYLMSGTIADQDQAPTVSSNQPMNDGKYIKNTSYLYSSDGNTYFVVDAYGEVVMEIYRGGAYIMLEEVAAYVFAFGEPPANHSESKNTRPTSSPWGVYLRVNHSNFSGDTSRYPYEPELPNISGCGGNLFYYEMDIGTTGTDCDPSYVATVYNDGTTITRGAARIVYAKMDLNRNGEYDIGEIYLFYTYNHYNDFQEYLNYFGGWGEMFGNITGGGTISSKYDYNPTAYPEVAYAEFVVVDETYIVTVLAWIPEREDAE